MNHQKIQLHEGEEIKLHFSPEKKLRFKQNEWIKIPFSILWSILCFFIVSKGCSDSDSIFFKFLGYIFYGAIFYILVLRFILKWIEVHYSEYYITNYRLIFKNNFFNKTKSLPYDEFHTFSIHRYNHRIGYIIIGEPQAVFGKRGMYLTEDDYIFENVEHATEKYHLIQQMKKEDGISLRKRSFTEIYSDICMESQIHLEKQLDRFLYLSENNAIRNAGSLSMLESFSNSILKTQNAKEAKVILDELLLVKRLEDYLKQFNTLLEKQGLTEQQYLNDMILEKGNCLDLMKFQDRIQEVQPNEIQFFKMAKTFNKELQQRK